MAILLVEQNAHQALALASRGYVLETGRVSAHGATAELQSDRRIQEAYLGGSAFNARPQAQSPARRARLDEARLDNNRASRLDGRPTIAVPRQSLYLLGT